MLNQLGLGLFLGGNGRASRFGHSGGNEGFRCHLLAYRDTGQGAVVMTNGDGGVWLVQKTLREHRRRVPMAGLEERQHALGEQRCSGGVVRWERGVGEEVLLTRVEEQLGPVGRVDEGLRGLEVLGEERVGVLAVHLHRDVLGPRVPELRNRKAGST